MVSVAFVLFRLISDSENGKADARVAAQAGRHDQFAEERARARRRPPARERRRRGPRARPRRSRPPRRRARQARSRARPVQAHRRSCQGARTWSTPARDRSALVPASRARQPGRATRHAPGLGPATRARTRASCAAAPASSRRARGGETVLAGTLDGAASEALPRRASVDDVGRRATAWRPSPRRGFDGDAVQVAVLRPARGHSTPTCPPRRLSPAASSPASSSSPFAFAVARLALAATADRRLPRRGAAPGRGRLLRRRARPTGHDEFAAARRRVQLDVPPARGAAGGAAPGARRAASVDAPARRVVRLQPRPRRAAGDRGAHRGGGRRRRGGPRQRLVRRTARAARGARRASGPSTGWTRRCASAEIGALRAGSARRGRDRRRHALAHPLRGADGGESVARRWSPWAAPGRPFSDGERELFHYLAGPGRGLDRERRPARDRRATGGHRRAHRPVQPSPLRARRCTTRGRALQALRPGRSAWCMLDIDDFKERQRHLRPPAGRRRPARGRAGAARVRPARSTSRRATAARSWPWSCREPTWRAPSTSPSACGSGSRRWGRASGLGHAARSRSRRASASRAPGLGDRRGAGWSRPPTRRCTRPSEPARTRSVALSR